MTYLEFRKYENVVNNLLDDVHSNLKPVVNYEFIKDCLQFAKHKVKLNNYLLKNSFDDAVYSIELFCEDKQGLKRYNIRPNEKNNTLFWVKLYTLEKSFVSYQQTKKLLNHA